MTNEVFCCSFVILTFVNRHSYLRLSVGCSFDALFAGSHPNSTPVAHETSNEIMIDQGEIGM